MHINLESPDQNAIHSYTDAQITIGDEVYKHSTIISQQQIISPWKITSIEALNEETIKPLLEVNPEIIIIGHPSLCVSLPITILQYLSKLRIGIECMSIGAACRTFNVLLNEHRQVVVGIIFS